MSSTQTWIKQEWLSLPHGFCLRADCQEEGIGREGRLWHSEQGGLYSSFILKLPCQLALLPWALWWSLLESLESLASISLQLKAPNDILFHSKKLVGMLIDSQICGNLPRYYICGFGINLNQSKFPQALEATSLKQITGQSFEPDAVLSVILKQFDQHYQQLLRGDFVPALLDDLSERSVQIGYNRPHIEVSFEEYWRERSGMA